MKIYFVSRKLDMMGGGSNLNLHKISEKLSSRGHSINIITVDPSKNRLPSKRSYDIIKNSKIETDNKAIKAKFIYNLLKKHDSDADIFHVFNPRFVSIAGLYREQGGKTPIVGRLNTYNFCTNLALMDNSCYESCGLKSKFKHDDKNFTKKILSTPVYAFRNYKEIKLMNSADRLFAQSPAVKRIYTSVGIKNELMEVVPNFYKPSFGDPESRIRDTNESIDSILFVGRLEESKGVNILLHSLNALPDSISVQVDIVGDGSAKESLITLAEDLGVSSKVNFRGWIDHDDLPPYYASADIFVHPGRWPEPFGNTVLEALQHGCIPIVSNIGGPPWVIGDAGLVFERGSPTDLAKKIENIITEEDLYKYNIAGNERLEKFSPNKIINKIECEYENVVN